MLPHFQVIFFRENFSEFPDLRVSSFSIASPYITINQVWNFIYLFGKFSQQIGSTIFTTVTNGGGATAIGSISIGYYISTDPNITMSDQLLTGGREGISNRKLPQSSQRITSIF